LTSRTTCKHGCETGNCTLSLKIWRLLTTAMNPPHVIGMDDEAKVELYIDVGDEGENKRTFDTLASRRETIERGIGSPLDWERLDDARASRMSKKLKVPGLKSLPERWADGQKAMIETMDRLVKVLGPEIKRLG